MLFIYSLLKLGRVLLKKDMCVLNLLLYILVKGIKLMANYCLQQVVLTISGGGVGRGGSNGWAAICSACKS